MGGGEVAKIALGGGITLSGFSDLDSGKLMVVKKMVGNFVSKSGSDSSKLNLNLKEVHKTETNRKYEIKGVFDLDGQIKQAEIVDYNLFFALNKVLTKLK